MQQSRWRAQGYCSAVHCDTDRNTVAHITVYREGSLSSSLIRTVLKAVSQLHTTWWSDCNNCLTLQHLLGIFHLSPWHTWSDVTVAHLEWPHHAAWFEFEANISHRGRPKVEIPLLAETESDVTHSAETVCATESKARLSAENRKSIVSGPTRLWKPASRAQRPLPNYPVHLISFTFSPIMLAVGVSLMTRPQGPTVPDADNAAASSV